MEGVEELVGFLGSPRADVRAQAVELTLGVTGTDGGVVMLNAVEGKGACTLLARILSDPEPAATRAAQALTNMSTNERVLLKLVENKVLWSSLLDVLAGLQRLPADKPVPELVHACVKLLNNLTTTVVGVQRFMRGRLGDDFAGADLRILLAAFLCRPTDLPEAGMVLTNMARLDEGRQVILDRTQPFFRLLTRLIDSEDISLRRATIETVRNCCFHEASHEYILKKTTAVERLLKRLLVAEGVSDPSDFEELPTLLKAAIEEARSKDEPIELEKDAGIRRAIVDTLTMLCTTARGRKLLRDKKSYSVIKAYHGHETHEETNEVIFKLVDFLLGEEDASVQIELLSSDDEDDDGEDDFARDLEALAATAVGAPKPAAPKPAPAKAPPAPSTVDPESVLFEVD